MDSANSAKDRAKQASQARADQKMGRHSLSARQGRTDSQGNNFTNFGEDASGFKLSPQTVMLICLVYIGSVVVLHIFGKVKSAAQPVQAQPDMGAGDM